LLTAIRTKHIASFLKDFLTASEYGKTSENVQPV